jgi:hypothetical protein
MVAFAMALPPESEENATYEGLLGLGAAGPESGAEA